MIHSVAPVQDQQGWGNVMYIPAAPWCPRNETYAAGGAPRLRGRRLPSDFPAEGYEAQWPDRFATEQLSETGAAASTSPEPNLPDPNLS